MASYRLFIKPSAAKELEDLPLKARQKLAHRIQALAGDPRPRGSEKLSGQSLYRIRQGDYRVVYDVQDKAMSLTVLGIGHRRDVYR